MRASGAGEVQALAEILRRTFFKWAGTSLAGARLPETWEAVAAAAIEHERPGTAREAEDLI